MEEFQPIPPSQPSAPAPVPGEAPAPGNRRVKRRLMLALIGLWVVSIVAGVAVILRPAGEKQGKGGESGSILALSKDAVGWIPIHGPIMASDGGKLWEKGVEQWSRRLRAMAETQGIKAIVLDINSPGGSVGAVQELYSQILRVRKEKNIPIVALFGDVAASGGYYIAAACDKIVAHPGTLTGSIGVIFQVSNMEGLFAKVGYKSDPIKSGAHKDIASPARAMTPEERRIMQALINDAYGDFVTAVAQGRNLPESEVRELADGRIFSGNQALAGKLVDQLGDSQDAVELAGKLAGIQGKPKVRRDVDSSRWFAEMFESSFGRRTGLDSLLSALPQTHGGLLYMWHGW
jgi:protease IV